MIIVFPVLLVAQTTNKTQVAIPKQVTLEKTITTVVTDNTGLNWIGTLDGLICYDGKRWHEINKKNRQGK